MTARIQCTHCSNPNQGVSPCRYLWWGNVTKGQWDTGGFDFPCIEDCQRRAREAAAAPRRRAVALALKCVGLVGVVVVVLALLLRSH